MDTKPIRNKNCVGTASIREMWTLSKIGTIDAKLHELTMFNS